MAVVAGPLPSDLVHLSVCSAVQLRSVASLQKPLGLDGSVLGIGDDGTAFTTAVSALDIFSLCQPARDATVLCTELDLVLQERFGPFPSSADGRWFPGLLGIGTLRKRVDFLSFWLGLGGHLVEDMSTVGPSLVCLLSSIRGMECFGHGVLELCRKQSRNIMLPSQELICLLQDVRTCAQDPAYWDEVIAAVPDDQGLQLSLPEVAEAVHVWLKDCVRAEVGGSDCDSVPVSPFVRSNRTSTVSLHASPTAAQAFSAWVGRSAATSEESSQGIGSSVKSQLTLSEGVESQLTDTAQITAFSPEVVQVGRQLPSAQKRTEVDTRENHAELQQAQNAAEIVCRHVDSAKSAQCQEAMRCLSTAHEAVKQVIDGKAAEIKDLQEELARTSQVHAAELEKVQELHKAEMSSLLLDLIGRQPPDEMVGKCVLCLDGVSSHASVPCGHLAFCGACAAERPSPECPVCRQPSQCVVRIFKP